jgi:hypothetical protein
MPVFSEGLESLYRNIVESQNIYIYICMYVIPNGRLDHAYIFIAT